MTGRSEASVDDTAAVPRGSSTYAWYVVAVLFFVYMSAAVDRFIIGIVVIPLKADFGLGDTEIGLLQGLAFALLYCLAGIPLGRLADVTSRRTMLLAACVAWMVSTAGSAFAASYGQLFAARLATGLAEAVLVPAGIALISTYIPRERLGVATSIFIVGATAGKAVAFMAGGAALAALTAAGGLRLAGLTFKPWQALFLLSAAPALLAALALTTIREPARVATDSAGWREIATYLNRHRAAFGCFLLMSICIVLIAHIFAAWAPSFFVRRFGLGVREASAIVGIAVIAVGPAGGVIGGLTTDALRARGVFAAAPIVIVAMLLVSVPATALFVLTDSLPLSIAGYCIVQAAAIAGGTQSYAGLQMITPPAHRGLTSAIFLTASTLAALGLGPLAVGIFSDRVFTEPTTGLGYSILTVLTTFAVIGLSIWPATRRGFRSLAIAN